MNLVTGVSFVSIALAPFLWMLPAIASDNGIKAAKNPREVVKEIVQDSKPMPDGTVQPSTGRAKPVENWFGCKPGPKQQGGCETAQKADKQ